MAFPQVAGSTPTDLDTAGTSVVVNLPASIASGDRLLMGLAFENAVTVDAVTGWTELAEADFSGTASHLAVLERIADGTEGATVTVTYSASSKCAARAFRITGAHASTASEIPTIAVGNSTVPNPPTLNPAGWDIEDTLWVAFAAHQDRLGLISSYPANYTNGERIANATGGAGASIVLLTARRELAAASEDPGVFTIDAIKQWGSYTVAVRPAAGGAPPAAPQRTLLGVGQ